MNISIDTLIALFGSAAATAITTLCGWIMRRYVTRQEKWQTKVESRLGRIEYKLRIRPLEDDDEEDTDFKTKGTT